MRRLLVRIHRWLGLVLGALFVLLGLTGSFNAFHREIDTWANPEYWKTDAVQTAISPSRALAIASDRYPNMKVLVLGLPIDGAPYTVNFKDAALAGVNPDIQFQLAINPATGAVTGPRIHWGGTSLSRSEFVRTIYRLHYELLAGKNGKTIVGLSGLFLIGLVALGIVVWWPRNGNWRAAFSYKRSAHLVRRMFDFHRLVGVFAAVVLLAIGFSGSYIVFPDQFHAATASLGKVESFPRTVTAATSGRVIPIEDAIAIAARHYQNEGATVTTIAPPQGQSGTYRVRIKRSGEVHHSGRTFLWIEPATGALLRTFDWTDQQGMRQFYAWQFPLHNGSLFGLPGRILIFIVGFAPLVLFATGWVVWRQKRRAQTLNKRRREDAYSSREIYKPACAGANLDEAQGLLSTKLK